MVCIVGILAALTGCSNEKNAIESSKVNSGEIDKNYVGDPNPELKEEYFQSSEESKIQDAVKKAISEEESDHDSGALSVH